MKIKIKKKDITAFHNSKWHRNSEMLVWMDCTAVSLLLFYEKEIIPNIKLKVRLCLNRFKSTCLWAMQRKVLASTRLLLCGLNLSVNLDLRRAYAKQESALMVVELSTGWRCKISHKWFMEALPLSAFGQQKPNVKRWPSRRLDTESDNRKEKKI